MLGTTREFLDYFGIKKLDDLPPLADIQDMYPELSPQSDFIEALEAAELAHGQAGAGVDEKSILDDEDSVEEGWNGVAASESLRLVNETESS
jgi:segregation and condensation protein B